MKKYLPCHDPAFSARFWPKSCHFCPFLSLFRHFFGCQGHKYPYFRHRSHMHLLGTYTKLFWSSFGHCHDSVMNKGASKMGVFLGQNQVTMAGSVWGRDPLWELFSTSNHTNTNRKTWFRVVLAPAIHPSCAQGGQKWLILRSKSGNNGRVIQGPWNHHENSLTPQITSIFMGIHDLGPLWPLPPSLPVNGGVKNGWFWSKN